MFLVDSQMHVPLKPSAALPMTSLEFKAKVLPRGGPMCATTVRILTVGTSSPVTDIALRRLAGCGWGSYGVASVREGFDLAKTFQLDVILASEKLPDGRGYDFAELAIRQKSSLLVGVALTDHSLWLPVIERGSRVLGSRAIGAHVLQEELVKTLTARAMERGGETFAAPAPEPKRASPPLAAGKRKATSAA